MNASFKMSRAELQTVQIMEPANIETIFVDVELSDKPTATKARVQTTCSACGGLGHNVATCHKRHSVRQSADVASQEDADGESDQ